jgi:hypothetical protein
VFKNLLSALEASLNISPFPRFAFENSESITVFVVVVVVVVNLGLLNIE